MSRATRPLRRVRGRELEQLVAALREPERWALMSAELYPRAEGIRPFVSAAERLGCRPSHLRRCLLGRVVSARAAGRILRAAYQQATTETVVPPAVP